MKSRVREFQDRIRDQGWRIKWIPHEASNQTLAVKGNPVTALGALGFVAGIALVLSTENRQWTALIVGGLIVMFGSLLYSARKKRADWVKLPARCIDREMGKGIGRGGKPVWSFRILCEFEYDGREYRVTPTHWLNVSYQTFAEDKGRSVVERELARVVGVDGMCWLYINPENPLQAEIASDDIKDKLLHH